MKNRIITISREFGSGGRTIGRKVAEKLGIPCYDAELIQKIAQESGFDADYIREAGEYTPGGFLSSALSNRSFGPTNEDYLWKIQYTVISDLAEKGSCVIVGRCADYILRTRPTACRCSFTPTWPSGPTGSSAYTASGRNLLRSGLRIRTSAGRPITGSTPI